MASIGEIRQTQALITTATDTAIIDISAIAGTDSSSFVEILELSVAVFVAAASTTIRFEGGAAGTTIAAMGAAAGTAIGEQINKSFGHGGWRLPANTDLSAETVGGSCTWYVACKYRLVI